MNPIKVTKCPNGYAWRCTLDDHAGYVAYLTSRGAAWTLAQAADNGRAHCRRHHPFQPGGYVPGEPDQRTRQALRRAALTAADTTGRPPSSSVSTAPRSPRRVTDE